MEMEENVCYNCGAELAKTYAEKEIIKQLQQDNARLKEENEQFKKKLQIAEDAYQVCLVNKETRHQREIDKYKQALEEIREIAKEAPALDTELSLRVLEVIDEVLK